MSADIPAALPVVILAGGLATRLRPITNTVPKVLVEVAGRPFLEHQLELLKSAGIEEVVLCVGHLSETIESRYGGGDAFGMALRYSYDGPKLLGTAGAIRKALPLLPEAFLVLYGDSYLPIDYGAVIRAFAACGKPALMTVFRNDDAWDRSNVWYEENRIRLYSKRQQCPAMRHIDYGLSAFRRNVFESLPPQRAIDLAEVLENLSIQGDLAGFAVDQRFYEIGSPSGLAELNQLLTTANTKTD